MKTCFTTWCTDNYREYIGLDNLLNSLKYFHPDIPVIVYNTYKVNKLKEKYSDIDIFQTMIPITCLEHVDEYDLIIHIDADSTVVGNLDAVIKGHYTVLGVRNNNDIGYAGNNPGVTKYNPYMNRIMPMMNFLNCGLIASTDKSFWKRWLDVNREKITYGVDEQDTYNYILDNKEYDVKIIDSIDENYYYGVSNLGGTHTNWDYWKHAYVCNNSIYMNRPTDNTPVEVKIFHVAGGASSGGRKYKQDYDLFFNDEVKAFIHNIIK